MAKNKFKKNSKAMVALATIATLSISTALPVAAVTLGRLDVPTTLAASNTSTLRNVMYYGDWSIWGGQKNFYPKDIPADQLTHLNFAFMDFDASGELKFCDKDAATGHPLGNAGVTYGDVNGGILNAFQVLRAENPNLKIGVSLGGWSKSGDFSTIAANASLRAKFVQNVMDFVKYANFDFVDVDWEYPASQREPDKCDNTNDEGTPNASAADKENYILLLQDLKNALNKQGQELGKTYELSVALPAGNKEKVDNGIDIKKLFEVVDFANIMTYDMRGAWDGITGHQAGLYTNPNDPYAGNCLSVDESVKHYLAGGAPSNKIVIGAAYYTRGWEKVIAEGTDPSNPGLFGEVNREANKDADFTLSGGALNEAPLTNGSGGRCGGVWSYNAIDELKSKYPGLKEYWDDSAKAPYLYSESTGAFFTYDNVRSIQEKAKYVKENNLGGMIAWMASQDKATTSTKRDELTKATKEALFGSADLPTYDIVYSPVNVTADVSAATMAWGTGGQLDITIKNNETLSASGEVLSLTETALKTLKNLKVYVKTDGVEITGGQSPAPAGSIPMEDGYYVIDFSKVYDGKLIKPGATLKFSLNTATALENLDGIVSVEVSQRMYQDSPEISRQVVYGEVPNPDNSKPVISGATNKTITVGDSFNALDGVTATDKQDGTLTSQIKVSGTVDTSKAGTYQVTYTVTDKDNNTTTKTITVTVAEPIRADAWNSTTAYTMGDKVSHNGHYWESLGWYVLGIEPGTNASIWKDLGPISGTEEVFDIKLLAEVAAKYNTNTSKYDYTKDGIVDIFDLVYVAKRIK